MLKQRISSWPLAVVVLVTLASAAAVPAAGDNRTGPSEADGRPQPGTERPELRTATSRTYVTDDGQEVARIYPLPVHFRDSQGRWSSIDNSLVDAGGGKHRNEANAYRATLPADASQPVRFELGGEWIEFGLLDAAASDGAVSGAVKRYPDVIGGIDLIYEAQNAGLEERLELPDADSPSEFRYTLRTSPGVSPKSNRRGGIDFVAADGETIFFFAPPFMYDASGQTSDAVEMNLAARGEVVVRADEQWLRAPARRFPVTIDPDVQYPDNDSQRLHGAIQECTVASGTSADTNLCSAPDFEVGFDGQRIKRALLKFDIAGNVPQNATITKAQFGIRAPSVTSQMDHPVDLHRVTQSWTTSATWNKHDGTNPWGTAGGDFASSASASSWITHNGSPRWYLWQGSGMQQLAQGWADGSVPNHGLLLKLQAETTQHTATFNSTQGDSTGGFNYPHFDVWYQHRSGAQRYYTFETQTLSDRSQLSVNVGNGNLLYRANDMRIPGTGLDLVLDRFYNHLPMSKTLKMSHGWRFGTGDGVFVEKRSNGDYWFDGPSGYRVLFEKQSDGSFTSPTGLDAKLTEDATAGTVKIKFLRDESLMHFDSQGRLGKQEDRNGNDITFAYSATDPKRLESITDTQDRTTTLSYDANGRLSQVTDPKNRTYGYAYDSQGLLSNYTDPDGKQTTYEYSPLAQIRWITDPRGNSTRVVYDARGRVKEIGRMTDRPTGTGLKTSFAYDGPTSPCNSTDHNGKTVVTDPRGKNTTYCWDDKLRVRKVVDPEGDTRSRRYTSHSNVDLYTAGSGADTSVAYDSTNRVTGVTAPADTGNSGAGSTFTYNSGNSSFRPDGVTDAEGNSTSLTYTTKGNLASSSVGGSAQVTIEYNDGGTGEADNGTVKWSEDGNGNRTNYSYDTKGNLTTIDPPGSQGDIDITYDTTISRVTSITDGKDQKREFSYDPLDRVTQVKFYNASGTLMRTDSYTYDGNGNRLTRADASGSYSYVYDKLNRMTEESRPGHPTTLYSYDSSSNLASITHAGEQILYTYNDDNTLASVKEPDTGTPTTTFEYNDDNSRTKTTYPNGVVETVTFDKAERAKKIKATKGTDVLTEFEYKYVRSGSATQERSLRYEAKDLRLNTTTTYAYDSLNRLDTATTTGSRSETYEYDFDNASNRTKVTHNGSVETSKYNAANELCYRYVGTTSAACGSEPSAAVTYSYDLNGDLISSSAGISATYNVAKQKTAYTKPGGSSTSFEYAGQGQKERTGKNSIDYADSVLGLSSEKAGTATTRYVRDEQGKLVAMRKPDGTGLLTERYYYLFDALGSVVAVTDSTGTVVRRHVYEDPYGDDVTSTGTTPNPWRFAGEYLDDETGLYKIGERYYDPHLARWSQKDPMMHAFSPREANGYTYVGGDPVNITDPNGTCFGWDACEDAAGAVGDAADDAWDSSAGVRNWVAEDGAQWGLGLAAIGGGVAIAGTCTAATAGLAALHCGTAGASLGLGGSLLITSAIND